MTMMKPLSSLPRVLRTFHLPPNDGSYVSGALNITGLGKSLFPPSPVHTVVRTKPCGEFGEHVRWTRSFGGMVFAESTYRHSWTQQEALRNSEQREILHDVESVGPFDFHLAFETVEGTGDLSNISTQSLRLAHQYTKLLGVIPVPKWILDLDIELVDIANEKSDDIIVDESSLLSGAAGWNLHCTVNTLGSRLRVIGYEGRLNFLPPTPPSATTPSARPVSGFHGIVLFDGHCNLCNASVDFLMAQDQERQRLLFAPQQSEAAQALLTEHGHALPDLGKQHQTGASSDKGREEGVEAAEDKEEDSVLLLAPDGRLHARSAAALHIGASLGLPWSLLSGLGLAVHGNVPGAAFALDAAYDYVGRRRLAWFGSKETCRIPTLAERQRFL